jgi:DNA modification methylase
MSEVKLYLGDCLEYMKSMPDKSVDAVITDPPYGNHYSSGWARDIDWIGHEAYADGSIVNNVDSSLRDAVIEWAGEISMAIFGTWRTRQPEKVRSILIWDKGPASGMGDLSFPWKTSYEFVYILGNDWFGSRDEGVLRYNNISRASMGRCHPHEKPVGLLRYIINKLPKQLTIYDPFMGSGTTGVACMQLGRNFIGCEIDPTYYAIAEKRIKQAQRQMIMEFTNAETDRR